MRRSVIAIAGMVGLGLPALAHASGQMPIMASQVAFKSHRACVKALDNAYAQDRGLVAPRKVEPDGRRSEVSLSTQGVERLGANHVRYDATLWFHYGSLRTDLPEQQIETSHTYEHRIRQCVGKTMKVTGEQGYTMSTFDPVEAPRSPKA